MAQHYKIESWSNEKWYPKIMKRINITDISTLVIDSTLIKFVIFANK